jgi:hypothetical protein
MKKNASIGIFSNLVFLMALKVEEDEFWRSFGDFFSHISNVFFISFSLNDLFSSSNSLLVGIDLGHVANVSWGLKLVADHTIFVATLVLLTLQILHLDQFVTLLTAIESLTHTGLILLSLWPNKSAGSFLVGFKAVLIRKVEVTIRTVDLGIPFTGEVISNSEATQTLGGTAVVVSI